MIVTYSLLGVMMSKHVLVGMMVDEYSWNDMVSNTNILICCYGRTFDKPEKALIMLAWGLTG